MKTTLLLRLSFLAVFSLSFNSLFSQESRLEFIKQELSDNYKVVYFGLDRSITEIEYKEIYMAMDVDPKILSISKQGSKACKLKLALDVTPEHIQKYLRASNVDYAYEAVASVLPKQDVMYQQVLPVHYPEKVKADGTEVDEASFRKAVEFWKRKYPKEWEAYSKNLNKQDR